MGSVLGILGIGGPSETSPVTAAQTNSAMAGSNAALGQQGSLMSALQAQNGIGNQNNVFGQLQGVANGTGPNPAQAQLAQATGQNVANQASLAAGQRGAAGNVGLMSRQAAQQGSNAQQQAAGQAATLQANQSLGALGQMSGIAGNQVANQMAATGANTAANQAQQGQLINAQTTTNAQNAGIASSEISAAGQIAGQMMGGSAQGAAGALAVLAKGGEVAPQSTLGMALSRGMASGGSVPVMLSPGEKVLSPEGAKAVANGASPMAMGKTVPGSPKVGGAKNSYTNDTFKTQLPPHSVVIPRSDTQSANPERNSAAFVRSTLAKKGKK
jgi:hypothetical protein